MKNNFKAATEKLMKNAYAARNEEKGAVYYEALKRSYTFWEQVDALKNSNKAKIFNCLYMSCKHRKYTAVKLGLEIGADVKTLQRYRRQFVANYSFNLEKLLSAGQDEEK